MYSVSVSCQCLILLTLLNIYRAGTYEHEIPRNRKVQWHQSFGGTPIHMPSIKIQSTIDKNTDKVSK